MNFVNPFDLDTDGLLILSSGATASEDVTGDVQRAESADRDAKVEFIKRMKLKTLEDMNKKVKLITSKNKIVQLKQQGNIAFQLFLQCQANPDIKINLPELLTYPLTPVPYGLATYVAYSVIGFGITG